MPFGVYSSGIPPLRSPARKIASNRVLLTAVFKIFRIFVRRHDPIDP
jgi:hypothetical protein